MQCDRPDKAYDLEIYNDLVKWIFSYLIVLRLIDDIDHLVQKLTIDRPHPDH
jgi:hypothetical protein